MNVKQKDVVLLPVIFSDQTEIKVRPAVVISNNEINEMSDDVMLVPLTSVLKEMPYSIMLTDKNLADGRLAAPSRARADKIFTADKSLIQRKIGTIQQDILSVIKQEIMNAI
ncbi:PemK-like, MazF-like toxin of type II toxin-antitoxin system [uncultured archaeon]|nr:PemK-like, MazF-like toxin of type II toxin-antitoxin system [uncultured archaeon]